jgi:hypothetical protein
MRKLLLPILLLLLADGMLVGRATALEVTCIEASKYKHLYRIFGNDPKRFAEFLDIDPSRLPNRELCRAALVSGNVLAPSAKDIEKLLAVVMQNQGWLAALHLASGGGSVGTGYQLGFLARSFWLKTYTVSTLGQDLAYSPDFFVAPLATPDGGPTAAEPTPEMALAKGWQDYLSLQKTLSPVQISYRGCASACGLVQVAGIDRFGLVRVHRARYSGKDTLIDFDKSMSVTNEGLMQSEKVQVAYYSDMDPGVDFIRLYQATPPETVTPVDVARYPRYVADYLNAKCGTDVGQLQRLERQIGLTASDIASPLFGLWIKTEHLQEARRKIREQRSQSEKCVAAAQEKERLAIFDKLCGRECDRQKMLTMVADKIRGLGRGLR